MSQRGPFGGTMLPGFGAIGTAGGPNYGRTQAPDPSMVGGVEASLNPPAWSDFAGGPWAQIPAYLPTLTLPYGPNVGLQLRRFPTTFTFTSLVAQQTTVQIDTPTSFFAVTAGSFTTDNSDVPRGRDPLSMFRVQFVRPMGDRFDVAAGLGSTMCGPASNPALLGPNGWMVDRGSGVQITVTPLFTPIAVDIVLWGAEVRGPYNYIWNTVPFGLRAGG